MGMMRKFELYWSDLTAEAQERLMEAAMISGPKEANWDEDIHPITEMEFEFEKDEIEPYDLGPGERKVEQMIREEEYREAGQDSCPPSMPLNMEED